MRPPQFNRDLTIDRKINTLEMAGKPESPKAAWETRTKYVESGRIAVVMVGLPARGKSFTARNLARYLLWIGVRTHVIALATIRNSILGHNLRASFFDPSNPIVYK